MSNKLDAESERMKIAMIPGIICLVIAFILVLAHSNHDGWIVGSGATGLFLLILGPLIVSDGPSN